MDDLSAREGQCVVVQGSSAPDETELGIPNPGSINIHDQVSKIAVEQVSYRFEDFITPDPGSSIWVKGRIASLSSLDMTLKRGGRVQRIVRVNQEFAVYTPLVTSINFLCASLDREPITERDLIDIQRQPWFEAFLKQFAHRHHAEDTINYSRLGDINLCTGDRMVLLLEALEFAGRLPKVVLGVVALEKYSKPWVIHYPCSDPQNNHTAWVFFEASSTGNKYYGFANSATQRAPNSLQLGSQQQRLLHAPQPLRNAQQVVITLENGNDRVFKKESDDEMEEDAPDADDEITETPKATPRKTAARVLARQIPLDAGMSVEDIIKHYPERVYYNNMLKVALKLSNKDIATLVHGLTLASGVVKRINTALEFIESEFDIDEDAFRTAFDRERKAADIPIRGKGEVPQDVLDANASKIAAAMAWIRTGGPRPAPTTTVASVAAIGQGTALPPSMGAAPVNGTHTAPTMGLYPAPVAGLSNAPVAHGYASGFGADKAIHTNSQESAPASNGGLSGYATPDFHLPVHMQNPIHAANSPFSDDIFYDYGAANSSTNHFLGSSNAPGHDQGSQMDVDGGNTNANDSDIFMDDGGDGIDWGDFMKDLSPDLLG